MNNNKIISPQRHEDTTNDLQRVAVANNNDQISMINEGGGPQRPQSQGRVGTPALPASAATPYSSNSYLLTSSFSSNSSAQPPLTSASSVVNNSPVVQSVQSVKSVDNDNDQRPMTNEQKQGIPQILIIDHCSLLIERHQPRRRRAAFSLAEILIAIFVLSIGLIMIAAVFPVAAKWTAQDAQTSVAQVIAKNAVAQIQAQFAAGNLPAGVLNSPTTAQPFAGFGPFAYQFGTAQPYPFGTSQAYSNTANFAPYPLNPAPATPTPAPVPPPGSYYWSAVMVPAASGYAGVSPYSAQMNNVYTVYVFVFNKGQDTNVFSAPTYGSPSTGNTLIPMLPYAQNSVASYLSFYPQLFEGEYQFAVPAMPVDSLGVDISTGSVFRLITDPATNALVPTGLAGGSVINTTSDYIIFAPPAIGQTSSPLIYVYVTTVNL